MNNAEVVAQSITHISKYVCQLIVDVKEKKKTLHIGLAELDIFIAKINIMLKDPKLTHRSGIAQSLIDLCKDAKTCLEGDLN